MPKGIQIDTSKDCCLRATPNVLVFIANLNVGPRAFFVRKAKRAPKVKKNEEGVFSFPLDSSTTYFLTYIDVGRTRTVTKFEKSKATQDGPPLSPQRKASVSTIYYAMGITSYIGGAIYFLGKSLPALAEAIKSYLH